jgi:hypothetical protein
MDPENRDPFFFVNPQVGLIQTFYSHKLTMQKYSHFPPSSIFR